MAQTDIAPLSIAEEQHLARCEETIGQHIASAFELGKAFTEIRDCELWRAEHRTFADYCQAKWSFTANWARKLISANEVKARVDRLSGDDGGTIVPLQNECQARELAKHQPEFQGDIWERAAVLAQDGKPPSASDIKRAAESVVSEDADQPDQPEAELKNGIGEVCQDWEADFFLHDDEIKEVKRLISRAAKLLGEISGEPGMAAFNVPALQTVLKGWVLPHLRQSEPYAGCTDCEGSGCKRCYNFGFKLRADYTKTAEEEPTDGELNFLMSLEKNAPADLPRHEVKRRLSAHIAHKRLTKPTKKMMDGQA